MPDPLRPLLEAARLGDARATGELIERTRPAVWRICSLLGSSGEYEDLVQETYTRALLGLGRFSGSGSVIGWLLAIARNTCADDVRRRQRQSRLHDRLRSQHVHEVAHLGGWQVVTDTLRPLETDQRDAFLLTQILGLRYEEAASLLGCPIGTVRSRVARGRIRLLDQEHLNEEELA